MFSESKVTEIFCMADDFCKEFAKTQEKYMVEEKNHKHRNKPNRMSDAEIMVILILFHSGGFRCFKHYYQEHTILGVPMVEIQRPNGYNDLYVPQGMIGDPASIMMGLASIQAVSAMARQMTHSLTWDFKQPNILILYNGWSGGDYEIELAMDHDPSLSTIPPSAMSTFIELCQYDLEEYFYQKLKRVQNLDLGIGSIELKIDDWADAANKKRDLLTELDETCNLAYEHIQYF